MSNVRMARVNNFVTRIGDASEFLRPRDRHWTLDIGHWTSCNRIPACANAPVASVVLKTMLRFVLRISQKQNTHFRVPLFSLHVTCSKSESAVAPWARFISPAIKTSLRDG